MQLFRGGRTARPHADRGTTLKIGMHAVYETSFEEAIRLAGQHGFDYVQFDLNCPQFYVDGLSDTQVTALRSRYEINDAFSRD